LSRKTRDIEQYLSYLELPKTLELEPTDEVYLVSDISRIMINAIQHEQGFDAGKMIDAFTHYLSDGSLFIPGFVNTIKNHSKVDMQTLKPETGGLSKEAFKRFKNNNCSRTNDPFHSFFVFGKNAGSIVRQTLNNEETFGKDSVFGYLHQQKGTMILVDLELYYGFTFAHYVEQQTGVKYRDLISYEFDFTDVFGTESKRVYKIFSKKKGYLPVLNGLEKPLVEADAMKIFHINGVKIFKIDLQKAFTVIEKDILENGAKNLIDFNLSLYLKQSVKQITG
jgi:aminoglycoside 3-N-acetyltransferase